MIIERDILVPARDGVGLATDVYRPAAGAPFPVILERTPYDKTAPSRSERSGFTAGHRLRLDLAGSNFPHFDINPNSGEPEGQGRRQRLARSRIFVDRLRPSHLVLPVIR